MKEDTRITYGAYCSWWDSIDRTHVLPNGLPVCPYCHKPLFEVSSKEEWFNLVDKHAFTHKGYRQFIKWLRGKCFTNLDKAYAEYNIQNPQNQIKQRNTDYEDFPKER